MTWSNRAAGLRLAVAHTSGTFADDLLAGNWLLVPLSNYKVNQTYHVGELCMAVLGFPSICLLQHTPSSLSEATDPNKWKMLPTRWSSGTYISSNELRTNGGNTYICTMGHTSSGSFTNDLAAGLWTLYYANGAWQTATHYAPSNLATNAGVTYVCLVSHTSGTFKDDLAVGRWAYLSLMRRAGRRERPTWQAISCSFP